MLIDSHCHLDYPGLVEKQDDVIARARGAGVKMMLAISTTKAKWHGVEDVSRRHDDIFCTVGIHPHHVGEEGEMLAADEIVAWAGRTPKIVGVGETGLDYYYTHAPVDAQKKSFCAHIKAAMELDLPLIIHSRDAETDTVAILREEGAKNKGTMKGVLHCFSSKRELAEGCLPMNFYVSLSGILTFKNSDELRATVKDIPIDRLLVETDSPYLAPVPYRGRPNEPSYVIETAKKLAEIKNVSFDEISRITTENFYRLFDRVPRHA
jgi:TatD DNase family protein